MRKLPGLRPQLPPEGHLHHPDPSGAGGAEPECPLPQPERQHRRPDQGKQPDLISKIHEEEIVNSNRIRPRRFSGGRPALDFSTGIKGSLCVGIYNTVYYRICQDIFEGSRYIPEYLD